MKASYRSLLTTLACSALLILSASAAQAVQFTFSIDAVASGFFETTASADLSDGLVPSEIARLSLTDVSTGQTFDTAAGVFLEEFAADATQISLLTIRSFGTNGLVGFHYSQDGPAWIYGRFIAFSSCTFGGGCSETANLEITDTFSTNVATYASPVPEPATLWLFGAAFLGFVLWTRRGQRRPVADC